MSQRHYKDSDILIKKGDTDSTLFILISGKLAVKNNISGDDQAVYQMHSGEVAGTRAFVDRVPRCATLESIGESSVYTLQPERLEELLDSHPRIVYKIMRGLFRITHINLMRMNVESAQLTNYITKTGGRY